MTRFDFSPYQTVPHFSGRSGVYLAGALVRAAGDAPSPRVVQALERLTAAAHGLSDALKKEPPAVALLQEPRVQLVHTWGALRMALEAKERLPWGDYAERAAAIARSVFPEGMRFLRLRCGQVLVASRHRLERIQEQGLAPDLAALVGTELLAQVEQAHAELRSALEAAEEQARIANALDDDAGLLARTELREAIRSYCRLRMGEVDLSDAVSIARFRSAMTPIDEYRKAARVGSTPPPAPEVHGQGPIANAHMLRVVPALKAEDGSEAA